MDADSRECAEKLTTFEIERIIAFIGYGKPEADVWFVGKEEGISGKRDDDACSNLAARTRFLETMDLQDAHKSLYDNGLLMNLELRLPRTHVWRYQSKIMLARAGFRNSINRDSVSAYIRRRLGSVRETGETFLTELSPVPSKSSSDKRLLNILRTRHPQFDELLKAREARIKELYRTHKPKLVICFSLPLASSFERLLDIRWTWVTNRIAKSTDGTCVLVPFLDSRNFKQKDMDALLSLVFI